MSACPQCGGTGFLVEERDGRGYAKPCACRRPVVRAGDAVDACSIPRRYDHCSLATFEPGNPSLTAALTKAMAFCSSYPPARPEDEGLGLLFIGDNGVGKTHLAVAVLRELVTQRGVQGRFWDFHELIREIRNSYNPETRTTELQVLQPVVDCELLVLDDLGAWKMTDWMNDTLFYLLNSRYSAKRPTIITTNFEDADREKVLAADHLRRKEYLIERIGQRLRSRLMEMCVVIRMQGADWRQNRQAGNQMALTGTPRAPRG